MWLGFLGPLVVRFDGSERPVMPSRQRIVLAALGLAPGRVISAETLASVLWDDELPSGAAVTVRSYVKRLRQALGPEAAARITTRAPGYLLDAGEDEVDVLAFRSLCDQGGDAARAGDWSRVTDLLGRALSLWRGTPLADVPSDVLRREQVPPLEQMRLQALESRVTARLNLGHHAELIPELQELVAVHPFREAFHGQFMTALYRAGRQGEALDAYRKARGTLVADLGVEPGEELQRLHHDILAGEPVLGRAPSAPAERMVDGREHRGHVVPRQLPAVTPHFAGREAALAELDALLPDAPDGAVTVITAVGGMAGVGKTALATRWAHRVADRFPDGQLYVNLRGFGPLSTPAEPAAAIRGFLESLGISAERIPADPGAQAGLYRSLLADRRLLIVLDNARDEAQVRPLLPGSPSCMVVVTSRTRLTGLAAAEGARMVSLDVPSEAEAQEMLAARLGAARVAAEPAAAAELVTACGRLPLALAIVAARAADRPGFPLSDLAAELREGLDALETGDAATSVQGVFGWSYRQLEAKTARLFRRLGLHPGHDISVHAAARLADVPTGQARKLLRDLVRRGLLIEPRPGRHVFHDLLRVYAARQAEMADSSAERRAALTRLFDDYLAMAGAAMDTLAPGERDYRPAVGTPDAGAPPVSTRSAARTWLNTERVNLIAVAGHAARSGWPNHAIRLSATLFRYLDDGPVTDVHALHSSALEAARQSDDRVAQADALRWRCAVDFRQGRYQQAADQLAQALAIYRAVGDQHGQGRTLGNIGLVLRAQGRYAEALSHQREALALAGQTGDRPGQAFVRNTLGTTLCRLGRYAEAAGHFGQALALYRELKDRGNEASVLDNRGVALHREGRLAEAEQHHELAVAIYREVGCRYGEAHALTHMGASVYADGRYQLAADCHRQALALYRAEGHPAGQAEALNGLGDALAGLGKPSSARLEYERALALASEVSERRQQARAQHGLGRAYLVTGDTRRAREHWEQALGHYVEMGFPEASEVRAALESLREKV